MKAGKEGGDITSYMFKYLWLWSDSLESGIKRILVLLTFVNFRSRAMALNVVVFVWNAKAHLKHFRVIRIIGHSDTNQIQCVKGVQ